MTASVYGSDCKRWGDSVKVWAALSTSRPNTASCSARSFSKELGLSCKSFEMKQIVEAVVSWPANKKVFKLATSLSMNSAVGFSFEAF